MKWASLPEWMQGDIEEREQRRDQGGGGLTRRRPLEARSRLGVGRPIRATGKRLRRALGNVSGPPVRLHPTTFKQRVKLRKVGRRAKRLAPGDKRWREQVWAVWGSCIITGEVGPHVHCHHMYDKSFAPQWRHEVFNGILLRWDVHAKVDEWPELHKALQRVADECRAAAEGKRPPVTRSEARSLIFQLCPRIRQYARPEEG